MDTFEAGNLFALDIETFTGTFPDGSAANGLDPSRSKVLSVALWGRDDRVYLEAASERSMLDLLGRWMLDHPAAVLVTWNGANFDFPFLAERAATVGSELAGLLRLTGAADRPPKYEPLPGLSGGFRVAAGACDHVDVMYAYQAAAAERGVSWSLKPVARSFGIDVIEVDRTAIHELDPLELVAYNFSDVRATFELACRAGAGLAAWSDAAA